MSVADVTPLKEDFFEKRPKLKRIKKKKTKFDLNTSTNSKFFKSFQSRMNISAANSSVVKASLRANNKALAQSLEKVRQDLRISYELNNDLKKDNQDLQLRLLNLERVAGLKDESLEKEVQRRIEDKTKQLKQILSSVSVHLLDAGSCLQDALDKCIDPTRLSVASSARNSSLGASDDACSPLSNGATSSIYYNPNTFSRVTNRAPKAVSSTEPLSLDTEESSDDMLTRQQLQEMTMIMEQSVLAEEKPGEMLDEVSEGIVTSVPESGEDVQTIEETTSPKASEQSNEPVEEVQTRTRSKRKSKATSNESPKVDRRGTFVVPPPVTKEPLSPEVTKFQNRRGTFVLNKAPQENNLSKRAAKRETFVVSSPGIPSAKNEEGKAVFKMPLPVDFPRTETAMDDEDATVYLNTDMELTTVVTVDQSLLAEKEQDRKSGETEKIGNKNEKEEHKDNTSSRIGKSSSLTVISSKDHTDLKASKSDSDVVREKDKSAVTLQLRKPGKIVFSAARKDWDGNRKVIPSKLPTRPRSKSKKGMKELKDSIAADSSEAKTIFDFHDKTPVHLTEKSRIVPSVYDLPDSLSPAGAAAKENNCEKISKEQKCDTVSVTYSMPMKGSPEDQKPKKARARSQSRSRSKTRKVDSENEDAEKEAKPKSKRGRSKSRTRKEKTKDELEAEDLLENSKDEPRRSRSQSRKRNTDDDEEVLENTDIVVERKSRSRSKKKNVSSADEENISVQESDKKQPSDLEAKPKAAVEEPESLQCSRKSSALMIDEDEDDGDFKTSTSRKKSAGVRKSARTKSLSLRKSEAQSSSSDAEDVAKDLAKRQELVDLEWKDDSVLLDDGPEVSGMLKPVSSRDFISRIQSESNASITENDKAETDSTKSKERKENLHTESQDEVGVATICSTRTREQRNVKKLASSTDDEGEELDQGNNTKVVPASDVEDHSDEEDKQKGTSGKEGQHRKCQVQTKEGAKTASAGTSKSKDATSKPKDGDLKKSQNGNSLSKDDVYSLPIADCPDASRGQSKVLKKVERGRSRSRKRVDVQDILNAFKEADDPDHSLRLNAIGKNDSVVIAEVIRNACKANDQEEIKRNDNNSVEEMEGFDKLCKVLEDTTQSEIYSMPLKDSPKVAQKGKERARSQSRGRSRSKKRTVNSDEDLDDEEFKPNKAIKQRKSTKEKAETANEEKGVTYTLPLKGSPDEAKRATTRSRSQSRGRVAERGRSRSRKRAPSGDNSPSEAESESRHSPRKTSEKASPLHPKSVKKTRGKASPIQSESIKKTKVKPTTENTELSANKEVEDTKDTTDREEAENIQNGDDDPENKVKTEFVEATPKDVGRRKTKEDVESKTSQSKNKKSTSKKSEKKKKEETSVNKTQQDKLKESFNDLKRKLSMMPRASERMSMTLFEKENEDQTNKRKRDSTEEKSDEVVEKRSRRAASASVSYKEPSVGAKLRRGDPGTSHFFSTAPLKMFKTPPRTNVNRRKNNIDNDRHSQENGGQTILDNISNTSAVIQQPLQIREGDSSIA